MEDAQLDTSQLGQQLEHFRPRLRRMVSLRLDPRLRRRIDSSDVIQESFVDVARRLAEYRRAPGVPFFVWVRFLTAQKLVEIHRRHLGTRKRDVQREAEPSPYPEPTSISLARALVASGESPEEALAREEEAHKLRGILEGMSEVDREILLLKHFEQLSDEECAEVLGLSLPGTRSRHVRALNRLREILRAHPDVGGEGLLTNRGWRNDG